MPRTVYQIRFDRLRDIIDRGGGQAAIADKMGVSRQYLNVIAPDHRRPRRNIGYKFARQIETVFDLSVGSLDVEDTPIPDGHVIQVPALVAIGASARSNVMHRPVAAAIALDRQWVRMNTSASSFQALAILAAPDTCMAPMFERDAILLVDTGIRKIERDGIYVLATDDTLFVKRVQRLVDGGLSLGGDNHAVAPQIIKDPAKNGLIVNGQVLLAWNAVKL